MSSKLKFIIGGIGVSIFVLAGLFVVFLYTIPKFTPMGLHGVYVHNKSMTYVGKELESVQTGRKIMIESSSAEIKIDVTKEGFEGEGRVVVFENANGIALNSMSRTQVDFFTELEDDGTGNMIPYSKIIIREPKGVMNRQTTVSVYLGLRGIGHTKEELETPYEFILNTGASNVTFSHAPAPSHNMTIDRLCVYGTGNVYLPESSNTFNLTVGELLIDSKSAHFSCPSPVTGTTNIKGKSSDVNLGTTGAINVQGTNHSLSIENAKGDINFETSQSGSLNASGTCKSIIAKANPLSLFVREAINLDIVAFQGSINVKRINGDAKVKMDRGGVQLGTSETGLGARGDIDVNVRTGTINVVYSIDALTAGKCKIRAVDSSINVERIQKAIDIYVPSAGNSNVRVTFAGFHWDNANPWGDNLTTSRIVIEGAKLKGDYGNINIGLIGDNFPASFHFRGAYSIVNGITGTTIEPDNCKNPAHKDAENPLGLEDWQFDSNCKIEKINGSTGSVLNIKTQGTVTLFKA